MSTTPRIAQATSTAIQQTAQAGQGFDGTEPAGDALPDAGHAIYKYATPVSGGGLFFWHNREPLVCSQIHIDLGVAEGYGTITVLIVNLDPESWPANPTPLPGESIIIQQATNVRYMALDEARFKTVLLPYQAIQVITESSGSAQIVQVVASLERTCMH